MKDLTKHFPLDGTGALLDRTKYTVVDIGMWDSDEWWNKEPAMLAWLKNFDHPSWFAWERPKGEMVFEDSKIAVQFVLKWS